MRRQTNIRAAAARWVLPVATGALAGAIFIMDTVTDLEIAVDVLYVVVVLLSVSFCQRRGILLVSAGCMALTVLSHFVTPTGSPVIGLINDGFGLVAILATTYLVLRMKASEAAMYAARAQLAHISRMTTLGELTTLIAHEINQPLAAIVTNGNACLGCSASRRICRRPSRPSSVSSRAANAPATSSFAFAILPSVRTIRGNGWISIGPFAKSSA
jgi:signal transduction histidine kinase